MSYNHLIKDKSARQNTRSQEVYEETVTEEPRINSGRLWDRHMRLAEIGALPRGGVNRQAMTTGDAAARQLLVAWANESGLTPAVDAIGNLFLRFQGRDPEPPPIMTGSHLDTQPQGGRFDGAYGVLAGLEALTTLREAGIEPLRSLELVIWNNEEGCRFAPTTMGSAVFAGALKLEEALAARDSDGVSVADALPALLAATPHAGRRALGSPVSAYIEAHIEQGPTLEANQCPVGIVTGIQGVRWFTVEVRGRAAHAGTTPRGLRRDALMSAVSVLRALSGHFHDPDDVVRFTVGRMQVSPNSPNTVPERVTFSIDFRHPDGSVLTRLGDAVPAVCQRAVHPCEVSVSEAAASPPVAFDRGLIETLALTAKELGIPHMCLQSGATHDAKWVTHLAPSGMIFVPCAGGISHSEEESATPEALAAGTRVLMSALLKLADGE